MTYPPPPYADAVTGTAVTGEEITGTWWAYPQQAGLRLGTYPPGITIENAESVVVTLPNAGLLLGSYEPLAAVNQVVTFPAAPGLLLGDYDPALVISSRMLLPEAGLVLGMYAARFIGQMWLYELDCLEQALQTLVCAEIELQPLGCR